MSLTNRAVKCNCAWPEQHLPHLRSILDTTGDTGWEVFNPYSLTDFGVPAYAINHESKMVIANWRKLWKVGNCLTGWNGYVPVMLCRQRSEDVAVAAEYVHLETLRANDDRTGRMHHWESRAKLTFESHLAYKESVQRTKQKKREKSKAFLDLIPNLDRDGFLLLQVNCRRSGNSLLHAASMSFRCNIQRKTDLVWVKWGVLGDSICVDPKKGLCNIRFMAGRESDYPRELVSAINSWQSDRNILRWVPAGPQWENAVFSELSKLFSVQS